MLKNSKKALFLALILVMLFPVNSLCAAITWDAEDMTDEKVMYENNFDGTVTGQPGKFLDTTTFADTEHKTVIATSGNVLYITDDIISKYILAGKTINVQFDYNASADGVLRFEFRNIAKNTSNNELALANANQQKYWTGDTTYKNVKKDGKWHSFNGTFDTASYLADLKSRSDFAQFETKGASLFIKEKDGKTVYIDNLKVSASPVAIPVNSPEVNAQSGWEKQSDADGHTDIYKSTVRVNAAGVKSHAFTGFAPGYFKSGSKYKVSFSFKEDVNNKNSMTRMWRMYNNDKTTNAGADTVKMNYKQNETQNSFLFHNPDGILTSELGKWYTVDETFTVGKDGSNTDKLIGDGLFTIYWESRAADTSGENFVYSESLNGDYTIYIADFKVERVLGASVNSNTVEFGEKQDVQRGGALSVAVSGYFDENIAPKIEIDGKAYSGEWQSVAKDGMLRTATAYFADVKSGDAFTDDVYSAKLIVTDIWENVKTNSLLIYFAKNQTQQVEITEGDWVNINMAYTALDVAKGKAGWNGIKLSVPDLIKNGTGLVKFSFDAQGESGVTYTADIAPDLRYSNSVDLKITIPASDLSDGKVHSYSKIMDLGTLGRYNQIWDNGIAYVIDRTSNTFNNKAANYTMYARASKEGAIKYTNIKLQYFNPDAANKQYVAARLNITNNVEDRFAPKGVLIFAKYNGSTLESIQYKDIDYKDTVTSDGGVALNNALGKDETKTVYITGHDTEDGAATELETNNTTYTYKVFYWNSFEGMKPLADTDMK